MLVAIGLAYSNSLVQTNLSSNDFGQAQKFMQTAAQTMDDVAWTAGKTGSVLYSSRYGYVQYFGQTLNYTVYVKVQGSGQYTKFASYLTGILNYCVPTTYYSFYNGYYTQVFPTSIPTLTLMGNSAPVARVFGIEKLPMTSGSYVRVATVPTIRYLNSTFSTSGTNPYYMRLYLTALTAGVNPNKNQDMTFTSTGVNILTINKVSSVNVTVTFPAAGQGFDSTFFHFPALYQIITPPSGYSDQVLELYVGTISVQLGV